MNPDNIRQLNLQIALQFRHRFVRFSFAASSALARQIENGSRADVFFSADLEWMDYLQARKLIQPATRHDVLGNQLVLIAPASSTMSTNKRQARKARRLS